VREVQGRNGRKNLQRLSQCRENGGNSREEHLGVMSGFRFFQGKLLWRILGEKYAWVQIMFLASDRVRPG